MTYTPNQKPAEFPPRLAVTSYSKYEDKSFWCQGVEVKEKGDYLSVAEHAHETAKLKEALAEAVREIESYASLPDGIYDCPDDTRYDLGFSARKTIIKLIEMGAYD